jgi:hypothetical protein
VNPTHPFNTDLDVSCVDGLRDGGNTGSQKGVRGIHPGPTANHEKSRIVVKSMSNSFFCNRIEVEKRVELALSTLEGSPICAEDSKKFVLRRVKYVAKRTLTLQFDSEGARVINSVFPYTRVKCRGQLHVRKLRSSRPRLDRTQAKEFFKMVSVKRDAIVP